MGQNSARIARQTTCVNQKKLAEAIIGVAGSGLLADYVLLTLRGLNIGAIEHFPDEGKGFLDRLAQGESSESFAERMNFEQAYTRQEMPENSSLIIDVGQVPRHDLYEQCKNYLRPSSDFVLNEPQGEEEYSSLQAGVLAGVLGKSIVDHCEEEDLILGKIVSPQEMKGEYSALIVGAGATGTYVALQAALKGFSRVDIMDGDSIEIHNLNRQVLYYDCTDRQLKANVLRERISLLDANGESYCEMLVDDSHVQGYDVIFSCVDRFAPRRILDEAAEKHGFLLVDGGTGVNTGRVMSHQPGITKNLASQVNISFADREEKPGCIEQNNPSIIMPNMIIGSYMVDEALSILSGNNPRTIRYDAFTNKVTAYE